MITQPLDIILTRDSTKLTMASEQSALAVGATYDVRITAYPPVAHGIMATSKIKGPLALTLVKEGSTDILAKAIIYRWNSTVWGELEGRGVLTLKTEDFAPLFPEEKSVDTTVRVVMTIASEDGTTYVVSPITVVWSNAGFNSVDVRDRTDAVIDGIVNGIRFSTVAEVNNWLQGEFIRPDGVTPDQLPDYSMVVTQDEGTFMLTSKILGMDASIEKNFTQIMTPYPMKGWTRILAKDGDGGFSVHSKDVYDTEDATRYGLDAIQAKSSSYTFDMAGTGIVRFDDLEDALRDIEVASGQPETVLTRVQALERRVAQLESGGTVITGGDGIKVSDSGVVSLEHDLAARLATVEDLKDEATVGDVRDVVQALINEAKSSIQ